MNIFALDNDPVKAAQYQCDKHVVKMIVESAQMLSTAHRLLDGTVTIVERFNVKTGKTRNAKIWQIKDSSLDSVLYKACHQNHPCTKWTMECVENYNWHYRHFIALCDEYEWRYGRVHATRGKLEDVLAHPPRNLISYRTVGGSYKGKSPFRLAMNSNPECQHPEDPVRSYREFYQTKQSRFKMTWTHREVPEWFVFKNA